ncbi:MAG: lysophospholipid acyltransferase family protein, partial [Clostridiales bacterium]
AVFLKKEESDLTAMRTVINTLKAGHSAAVFPEGRRTFKEGMTEFKPGAAYLAARTGVVVVPVALINTADFLKFWKRNVMINIGMPIFPDQTKLPLSEQVPLLTQRFTEAVTSLHSEIAAILEKEGK